MRKDGWEGKGRGMRKRNEGIQIGRRIEVREGGK